LVPNLQNLEAIIKTSVQRDRGFTLVELLVVIAIIGLLITMVSGVIQSSLVASRRSVCASNMRSIGQAVFAYATDHRGRFPPTRHSASHQEAWIFLLAPYLGEVDAVRISPADPKGQARLRQRSTSYILNDVVVDPLTDPFGEPIPGGYGRIDLIPAPTMTLLAAVISDDRGTGPANDHTHARLWTSYERLLSDVEADRHRKGNRHPNRTEGDAPYLHVDTSVRIHLAKVIQPLLNQGVNIGLPGNAP